jgi:hypothetical protein
VQCKDGGEYLEDCAAKVHGWVKIGPHINDKTEGIYGERAECHVEETDRLILMKLEGLKEAVGSELERTKGERHRLDCMLGKGNWNSYYNGPAGTEFGPFGLGRE